MKHDNGKLRYDLVDDAAMDEMVAVLTYGAELYAPNNWRTVEGAFERYVAAARRHLSARRQGQKLDRDTSLLHLAHLASDVHFLLALELEAHPEIKNALPERLAFALARAREKKVKP